MPPMDIVNLVVQLIPIAGQTASEISALIAALKATASQHGFDLDTQALTAQHAEAVRREAIAAAEALASEPPPA